ncbi:MAG: hypothetical protein K1X91_10150 [Bacteriodetes bacterium]|nr:hypothetical protein [Bacteroidota bacterium]
MNKTSLSEIEKQSLLSVYRNNKNSIMPDVGDGLIKLGLVTHNPIGVNVFEDYSCNGWTITQQGIDALKQLELI